MKKKKLNSILIVIVLSIWGVLIHNVVKSYFFTASIIPVSQVTSIKNPTLYYETKKDSFQLVYLQRDPFLNMQEKKNAVTKKTIVTKKAKPIKRIVHTAWPANIEYYGFIKGKKSKSRRALLRIDGVLHRLKQNEKVVDIRVKNIMKDSIILLKNNEQKTFFKKK